MEKLSSTEEYICSTILPWLQNKLVSTSCRLPLGQEVSLAELPLPAEVPVPSQNANNEIPKVVMSQTTFMSADPNLKPGLYERPRSHAVGIIDVWPTSKPPPQSCTILRGPDPINFLESPKGIAPPSLNGAAPSRTSLLDFCGFDKPLTIRNYDRNGSLIEQPCTYPPPKADWPGSRYAQGGFIELVFPNEPSSTIAPNVLDTILASHTKKRKREISIDDIQYWNLHPWITKNPCRGCAEVHVDCGMLCERCVASKVCFHLITKQNGDTWQCSECGEETCPPLQ